MFRRVPFILAILLCITPLLFAEDGSEYEDHLEHMEGPFETPQEITATCLECHDAVGEEILKTQHWNWQGGAQGVGKRNMVNNFCIAISSNWGFCTPCHIGYGWENDDFDFSNTENIDCLVCHDATGAYNKHKGHSGMPDPSVDLVKAAQSVGKPVALQNCGSCHFKGGGGNGVKHGDLDESLLQASSELDVHIGGNGMNCTDCHTVNAHHILGAGPASMARNKNHIACIDCHDAEPHEKEKLNRHISAVACQTCHIPTFARGMPTKTWWDWSTAGQDIEVKKDEYGKPLYNKKKGSFKWEKNARPVYRWFNGGADYYRLGDKIDPQSIVTLNRLRGDVSEATAKIYPFKLMRGKQIYDTEHSRLIVPKLFDKEGKNSFWSSFDWNISSSEGMKSVGMEFSGSYDFIETELYVPIHHTVAPAKKAMKCHHCHHKSKGLLDWEALGYTGDPMANKGREKNELLK
ncbi:MAG: hypothetical protein B6244_07045 [Candidatus Cloacimonetes bacterium 4572_55]|nr:MAG: hypothetical protein B6244_07045 [Candidatus Cloacimonetes bacterium 4572_55]